MDTDNKCAVEIATNRGPHFNPIAVRLFEWGCSTINANKGETLSALVERRNIDDLAVSIRYIMYLAACKLVFRLHMLV